MQTLRVTTMVNVTFSPDSKQLVTYSPDKRRVRLWDVATGRLAREATINLEAPPAFEMTSAGFVAVSPMGKVFMCDRDGGNLREIARHDSMAGAAAVSLDGRRLASAYATGQVCIWDLASGKRLKQFQLHPPPHEVHAIRRVQEPAPAAGQRITEAACKTIFTQRLKLSGMRWTKAGAQTILDLRVLLLSGVWDAAHARLLSIEHQSPVQAYQPAAEPELQNAA